MRLNPPRFQVVPVAWAGFCLFGLGVAVQKLFEFPYLSPGWQGGVGLIVLVAFGFVSIEAWWLASQREIHLGQELITIRSWLQVVLARPGQSVRWADLRSVGLVFDSGRKLELRTQSGRLAFWAAIWDPASINSFLEVVRDRHVPTTMEWTPGE